MAGVFSEGAGAGAAEDVGSVIVGGEDFGSRAHANESTAAHASKTRSEHILVEFNMASATRARKRHTPAHRRDGSLDYF